MLRRDLLKGSTAVPVTAVINPMSLLTTQLSAKDLVEGLITIAKASGPNGLDTLKLRLSFGSVMKQNQNDLLTALIETLDPTKVKAEDVLYQLETQLKIKLPATAVAKSKARLERKRKISERQAKVQEIQEAKRKNNTAQRRIELHKALFDTEPEFFKSIIGEQKDSEVRANMKNPLDNSNSDQRQSQLLKELAVPATMAVLPLINRTRSAAITKRAQDASLQA